MELVEESITNQDAGSEDIQQRIEEKLAVGQSTTNNEPEIDKSAEKQEVAEETKENTQEPSEEEEVEVPIEANHLAKVLGIDESQVIVDEDGKLFLRTKVDGEIGKVTLPDLIKSFQTEAHITRKSQQLAEEKQTFEAIKNAGVQVLQKQLGEISAVTTLAEQQLTNEYHSIDWTTLRVKDPAEWTAKRQEFSDRVQQINTMKAQAMTVLQQQMEKQAAETAERQQSILASEAEALRAKIPEWNDVDMAKRAHAAMKDFVKEAYGFEPSDLDSVSDHRLILVVQDAMKYRQSLQKTAVTEKLVKTVPKIVKPGNKSSSDSAKRSIDQEKISRLKASGNIDALAAILESRM